MKAAASGRAGGGPTYTLEQLKAAVDEAHKAGRPVAVHAHAAEAVRRAILAGADTVEHGALMDDAVIDLLVEKQVVYVPNLYLAEYYLANGQKFHFNEEQLRYTRDFMKPRAEAFAKAVKKGARIVFGTDAAAGMPGHTAPEFERRVALGMPPRQAIVHATSTPAKALGMGDKIGDLKPGMFADIIAVEGNPLEDIKALGHVAFVMKEGMSYKDVVSTNVYLRDMRDFDAMNKVYREVFKTNPPVRATTEADLMLRGGLIEISAIAARPDLERRFINPQGWSTNPLPYSRGIAVGDHIFLAGLVSQNPQTGDALNGDIKVQTKQILENAKILAEAAGFKMSDMVWSRVWLTDPRDVQDMNDIYRTYFAMNEAYVRMFKSDPPARATVGSQLMSADNLVEIAVIAVK